jgi:hypothetical protein
MPSKLVLLSWDDGFPGLGIGGGPATPPVYPSHGLPGMPAHPGHDLPGMPPHVGGGPIYLPVFPYDPTKPVDPDKPPPVYPSGGPVPGGKYLVKYLACVGLILVPDAPAVTPQT